MNNLSLERATMIANQGVLSLSQPAQHKCILGSVTREDVCGVETDQSHVGIFDPGIDLGCATGDVDEQIRTLAGNTGNMLFMAPLRGQILADSRIADLGYINREVRTLVLSMGNWISSATDYSGHATAIERSNVERIVVLGAGAQAQASIDEIELQSGTRRFLDIVAERSVSIGVRGDFTAAVLDKFGIRNVDVIGCPSVFMFGEGFRSKVADSEIRLAVNTTWHGHYRDAIAELLAFGRSHDALLVEQSEKCLMRFCQDKVLTSEVSFLARYYSHSPHDAWSLMEWLRRKLVYYTKLGEWRDAMNQIDLVVGSRFHGAIAAMLSGARALLLTMDTRTKELAEYLNLPSMPFQHFDGQQSPESYYSRADPALFLATFADRKARFQAFLIKNGLPLTLEFGKGAPSDTGQALRDPTPQDGELAIVTRFISDAEKVALKARAVAEQLKIRLEPLRSLAEGKRIDTSEFVIPFRERAGPVMPAERVSWRRRQGVPDIYIHQPKPEVHDDRVQRDQAQPTLYINAELIARSKKFTRIADFRCGSGFNLLKFFSSYKTVGIEIEPALSDLHTRYPDRDWYSGEAIHPNMFDADLVICADTLEKLTEPDYLLEAMAASNARVFVLSASALEILADRGLSSRFGPPKNTSRVFEWTTSELHALVSRHLTVIAHAIVDLNQATQVCVAVRKQDGRAEIDIPTLVCT